MYFLSKSIRLQFRHSVISMFTQIWNRHNFDVFVISMFTQIWNCHNFDVFVISIFTQIWNRHNFDVFVISTFCFFEIETISTSPLFVLFRLLKLLLFRWNIISTGARSAPAKKIWTICMKYYFDGRAERASENFNIIWMRLLFLLLLYQSYLQFRRFHYLYFSIFLIVNYFDDFTISTFHY